MNDNGLDRAAWSRLGSSKTGCAVSGCTVPPAVSLNLSAKELTGGRGGANLASAKMQFCAAHAEQRYIGALSKLRGEAVARP